MAGTTTRWVLGCGGGCGVLLLLVVAAVAVVSYQIRNVAQRFDETEAIKDTVVHRFGGMEDFTPFPEGAIPAERVRAFLRVRELGAPARKETEDLLEVLARASRGDEGWSPGRIVRTARAAAGMIRGIADFYDGRSHALLEGQMGLGEYYYLYVMAYYSLLEKSPADGPPFRLVGDSEHDDDWDEHDVREHRREHVLQRVRRQLLPMLRRQLGALEEVGTAPHWRETVAAEIAAMEADAYRWPWADGLPEVIEASLLPFRERLEASYSELCNPLEAHQH